METQNESLEKSFSVDDSEHQIKVIIEAYGVPRQQALKYIQHWTPWAWEEENWTEKVPG